MSLAFQKKVVVHWDEYDRILPSDNSSASKIKRRALFDEFDPAGNGILQQAAVVRSIFRLFPRVAGITDTRSLIHVCFRVARDTAAPITPISVSALDRNEFRVLLLCLKCYLKAWEVWYNFTLNEKNHDELLRLHDINLFQELFESWGYERVDSLMLQLRKDLQRLDTSQVGAVKFEAFADAALRRTLPFLSQAEEDAEKDEAKRLLQATHAHLFSEDRQKPTTPSFHGGVTQALGRRPRRSSSAAAFDGSVTTYVKDQVSGWPSQAHSQYRHDFATPKFANLKRQQLSLQGGANSHDLSRFLLPTLHQSKSQPSLQMFQGPSKQGGAERWGPTAAGGSMASPAKSVRFTHAY